MEWTIRTRSLLDAQFDNPGAAFEITQTEHLRYPVELEVNFEVPFLFKSRVQKISTIQMRETSLNVDECRLSRIWTDLSTHMKASSPGHPHKDLLSRESLCSKQACDEHVSYCAFSKPHLPPTKSCCLFDCLLSCYEMFHLLGY